MPPQLPPESHYDPKKLDKIFAIIAIVMLLSLVGMFAKDYSRQWKDYQRQYRAMEVEKARVKADSEDQELSKNEDYQNVLKELAVAQKEQAAQGSAVKALGREIFSAEAVQRLHTQQSQFAKAEYDALKYKYEHESSIGAADAPEFKVRLDKLGAKIEALRLKIEDDTKATKSKTDALKAIEKKAKDLDKKRMAAAKKREIIERKLKRIDIAEMSPANQLAEMVRDMPIIDLANPNYKIQQIVVKDIPEDVNFMKVQRVDRCTTCHLGINNPDFKEAGQPFKTHPNLELFMDKNSPHPVEAFACTTCHGGRGRATDFIAAAHTPKDEAQKKEWEKKYKWVPLEHWENPMLPTAMTQASCLKCHEGQGVVKGADKLNFGMALIERAGCYGCHTISKYKDWPKSGPSLEFLASKTTKDWAYNWITDPKSIRPDTWMPSYFDQSNNNDPASRKRSEQEVNAIVHFLFANSKSFTTAPAAFTGDEKHGKELVASIGCLACHQVGPVKEEKRTRDSLHHEFGPNLVGLGSKTSQAWLFDWLKDPKRYHGKTRMPSLRLDDQEAADIAAYLIKDKSSAAAKSVPAVNDKILDGIVLDLLKKSETIVDSNGKLKGMDRDAKLAFAGQRLVREYGCYSCHNIPGFENEKPIGVELTEEGSKSIERLDFGFVHLDHTKQAWFKQKLMDPRIFDHGKVVQPLERIKMPNFHFTTEEADAVATVIMGLVKDRPDASKMAGQGVKAAFINDGQKLVKQFNCQACHLIEGDGGTSIQPSVTQWLVDYQGREPSEAKNIASSFAPPRLIDLGEKLQAQWMFDFLNAPSKIRQQVEVRMPTYGFHAAQTNSLVKYFNYLDGSEFPFIDTYHPNLTKEEFEAAENLVSKEAFDCGKCHFLGDRKPDGNKETWAPNLAMTGRRLQPDWMIKWITNPAAIDPATKMPTFYDPNDFDNAGPGNVLNGDERRQIKALRDYLLTISADASLLKQHAAGAAESAPAK